MTRRILSIGQCGMDHGSLSTMLRRQFAAETVAADSLAEALDALRHGTFDLALVNRRLDADGGDGLEVIRDLKADERFAALPVMLVTNYPEFDAQAVALGARPGFGKQSLHSVQTHQRLAEILSDEPTQDTTSSSSK